VKIAISPMGGMRPIAAAHLLKDTEAQIARNIDPDPGTTAPMFKPPKVAPLTGETVAGFFKWPANSEEYWAAFTADVDAVRHPAPDDEFERVIFTGLTEPRFFANDNISDPFDPATDFIKLGVTAPAAGLTASGYTPGTGYRVYVYTFVNRYGEEGPPSPLETVANYASGNVTLTGFSAPPSGRAIEFIRLYRTNSATVDISEFQLVFATDIKIYSATATYMSGDLVVYNGSLFKCVQNNTTGVTPIGSAAEWDDWYDGIADADLQPDVLVSMDWEPPPAGLQGIVALPNGVLAGFLGRTIYMSEPGYANAWPQGTYSDDFRLTLNAPIVGLDVQGASLAAMTTGKTAIVSGTQPDQMIPHDLAGYFPCVSKRSISASPTGTLYAARAGLIQANADGLTNVLAAVVSEEDWQAYTPANLIGRFHNDKYIGFYGGEAGIMVDPARGFFEFDFAAFALHVADDDGILYLASNDDIDPENPPDPVPLAVRKWVPDGTNYLYGTWKSRLFITDAEVNLGAARVIVDGDFTLAVAAAIAESEEAAAYNASLFATGDVGGGFASAGFAVRGLAGDALMSAANISTGVSVTFTYFADGVQKKRKTITNARGFKLPGGFRARRHEVQVEGYAPAKTIELASGMEELYR